MNVHIEFAKRSDGSEIKHRFILTLKKRLNKIAPSKINELFELDGVDLITPAGAYSLEVILAQTFNIEDVIGQITLLAEQVQSDLIVSQKIQA